MAGLLSVIPQLNAQSREELNNLFFDAVYPDDPEQILLSSAARSDDPGASVLQPEAAPIQPDAIDAVEDISAYEANINTLIEGGGTFDPGLAQTYLSLGTLYLQAGDYERAMQAFENNMHIHRVNQGLFTLEQVEAVRSLIDGNKQAGNFAEADKYHEYLYYLMAQNLEPGSEDLTAAALEWADWNMEAFRRMAFMQEEGLMVSGDVRNVPAAMLRRRELVAMESNLFSEVVFVPRSALFGGTTPLSMQTYTPDQLLDPRLDTAKDIFEDLPENDAANPDVVHRKADIVHLFKSQLEEFVSDSMIGSNISTNSSRSLRMVSVIRRGYADTREELLAIAASEEEMSAEDRARAYIDLADWDLAFERPQRAQKTYAEARDILLTAGYSDDAITRFITPEPARFIPEYVSYAGTRAFQSIPENMDIPYIGFIDVSFNKRSNGELRNIRITGATEDTTQQVRNRLIDMLRKVKTRPLIIDGEREAQDDIRVRYYYSY